MNNIENEVLEIIKLVIYFGKERRILTGQIKNIKIDLTRLMPTKDHNEPSSDEQTDMLDNKLKSGKF